ncbi:MAG: transporter substrate-binding domain-containing protein [Oligoflexia bacterium]|nr:transporter substrate-binding domain-containing protein [Oligoflexia bacterium]
MFNKSCLIIFFSLFMSGNYIYSQELIRFAIPDYPPYTFEKDGQYQGIGVELIAKIMKEANIEYSIQLVPNYGRAIENTGQGYADGFFLASENSERNEIAVLSKSLVINKWCWVYPKDSSLVEPSNSKFKEQARVGTPMNTNLHKWLIKNKYDVGSPPKVDVLFKMLKSDYINVLFLPDAIALDLIKKEGDKAENYKIVVHKEQSFGIYISKKYLSANPDTMTKINAAIDKVIVNENKSN